MFFSAGFVQKKAGAFEHNIRANFIPFEGCRVTLLREANFFAVNDQGIALHRNLALEAAMHRVILQHVGQIVGLQQVVDANDFNIAKALNCRAKDVAADATKTIDAYFDCHVVFSVWVKETSENLDAREGGSRVVAKWWLLQVALDSRLCGNDGEPYFKRYFLSTLRTVSATFSGVKPKCLNSAGAGADSP